MSDTPDGRLQKRVFDRRQILTGGAAMMGAGVLGSVYNPAEATGTEDVPAAMQGTRRSERIRAENAKPGSTDWLLTRTRRGDHETYEKGWDVRTGVQGFASHMSIKAGEVLRVYVSAEPADEYRLDIYRMGNGSGEFLLWELPLAFWLEKEGYDVTYISNLDTHEDGVGLLRGRVFLSVGHDEYWTIDVYNNVRAARDAGVHLAFLSGNSVSGQITLLTGSDGRPRRGIRSVPGGLDSTELMGARSYGVGFGDWICAAPDHWIFEGTGMQKGDYVRQLVGWEFHGHPVADQHKDLVVLAEGPVRGFRGEPNPRRFATTLYTAPKGNFVFNAATCWWNMVLSAPPGHATPPFLPERDLTRFHEGDDRVRHITRNLLDRMIATPVR